MSATLDLSSMSQILKEIYDQKALKNLTFRNNPFFALLVRDEVYCARPEHGHGKRPVLRSKCDHPDCWITDIMES